MPRVANNGCPAGLVAVVAAIVTACRTLHAMLVLLSDVV